MIKIWYQESDQYGHIEEKIYKCNNLADFDKLKNDCENIINVIWIEELDNENHYCFGNENFEW